MQKILEDFINELDLKVNCLSDIKWYFLEDIAFSVVKEYPQNVLKRMKVTKGERYVAHLRFGVSRDGRNNKFPITIICHLAFCDKNNPKEYFLENWKFIKRRLFAPRDIRVYDEYFLDTDEKKFFRLKNRKYIPINLIEILNNVFDSHIKTFFYIRPAYFFLKKCLVRFLLLIFQFVQLFFQKMLWAVFGVSFKYDYLFEKHIVGHFENSKQHTTPESDNPEERIPFFGFNISKGKLFRFILINVTLIYLLKKQIIEMLDFKKISSSTLIIIFYMIIALIVFLDIIPYFIRQLIKFISFIIYKLKLNKVA